MKKINKKPELLVPAGDLERLKVAFLYGADAVFLGGQQLGLRSNAKNFSLKEIKKACEIAKLYNGKIYVTTNIVPHEKELDLIDEYLINLQDAGVTGIIVTDFYMIKRAQIVAPELEIHISTQTSITNLETIKFLKKFFKIKRVVLARELNLTEIKYIKENSDVEIEVFIHGALCIAYSGRCVLSNHMTSRDSNRGGCCQSCRWEYEFIDNEINVDNNILFSMNPKDLNTVKIITKLIDIGVDCFKIEGRMKSIHYVATTTLIYRKIIDLYFDNPNQFSINDNFIRDIEKCANRQVTEGFLLNKTSDKEQLFNTREEHPNKNFLAISLDYCKKNNLVKLQQRNYFTKSDKIEIIKPSGEKIICSIDLLYNEKMEEIDIARHPQEILYMYNKNIIPKYSIIRRL